MAKILSGKWANQAHTTLKLDVGGGGAIFAAWPDNKTHWGAEIQAWLDGGGVIEEEDLSSVAAPVKKAIRVEGVARIAAAVPEWDSLKKVKLIASLWNMLGAPNASQALARDIYLYVTSPDPAAGALAKIATLDRTELGQVVATDAAPFAAVDGAFPGWPT